VRGEAVVVHHHINASEIERVAEQLGDGGHHGDERLDAHVDRGPPAPRIERIDQRLGLAAVGGRATHRVDAEQDKMHGRIGIRLRFGVVQRLGVRANRVHERIGRRELGQRLLLGAQGGVGLGNKNAEVPWENHHRSWAAVEGEVQERYSEKEGAVVDPTQARKRDGECSLFQPDKVLRGIRRLERERIAGEDAVFVQDFGGEEEAGGERGVPMKLSVNNQERLRAQIGGRSVIGSRVTRSGCGQRGR